ncbi:MAG: type II toxin-antitoxin system death-on-curing family toxin [Lachnospiraceae bacterium]
MISLSKQQITSMHCMLIRQTGGLVDNHAFNDGNKRIGILVMLTFMELNGMKVQCADYELVDLVLSVASGISSQKDIWIVIFHCR